MTRKRIRKLEPLRMEHDDTGRLSDSVVDKCGENSQGVGNKVAQQKFTQASSPPSAPKPISETARCNAAGALSEYTISKRATGKGKFSTVYKARRRRGGLDVALKCIDGFGGLKPTAKRKCLKEVKLLRSLSNHCNIIKFYQAFQQGNELIIALEWASGGDLKRRIRRVRENGKRFSERVIFKYFYQAAAALAHMHSRGVLHRDVKPANILLLADGTIKVGDLGLARTLGRGADEFAFSKVGTPLYMAPEVLHTEGYSWNSDVWSLGCILYELSELRSPFKEPGISLVELFKKISGGVFPKLGKKHPGVLRKLTHEMLMTDPALRPSMAQVETRGRTRYEELAVQAAAEKTTTNDPEPNAVGSPHTNHVETAPYLIVEAKELLNLLDYPKVVCAARFSRGIGIQDSRKQYSELAELCIWLLNKANRVSPVKAAQEVSAEILLKMCSSSGIPEADTFRPVDIMQGWGWETCSLLKLLATKAALPVQILAPSYQACEVPCTEVYRIKYESDSRRALAAKKKEPKACRRTTEQRLEEFDKMVGQQEPRSWRNVVRNINENSAILCQKASRAICLLGQVERLHTLAAQEYELRRMIVRKRTSLRALRHELESLPLTVST